MTSESMKQLVGLPPRPFLYTPDQIASLLGISIKRVYGEYLFYMEQDNGTPKRHQMRAHDIGPDRAPDWRVSEEELVRWLRRMKFQIFDRTSVR